MKQVAGQNSVDDDIFDNKAVHMISSNIRKRWNNNETSLLSSSSAIVNNNNNIELIVPKNLVISDTAEMKSSTIKRSTNLYLTNYFLEVSVRLLLFTIFIQLERAPAFKRKIQPEELYLYKYPTTKDYVPAAILMPASFIVPFIIICINFLLTHDKFDFMKSINVISLAIPLNGVLTSLLKITIGRPRPDFFYRCFPDGNVNGDIIDACTGDARIVNEGRKSFPSGHSSFAFAGFGFIFLYLAAKLHCFNERGRGQSWRLCVSISPLFIALLVAISRTCDYHHHWQDVVIGSIIGMLITFICYRQYYPSIFSTNCHRPYCKNSKCYVSTSSQSPLSSTNGNNLMKLPINQEDQKPLLEDESEKESKWI